MQAETDGIDLVFNDDGTVTLRWDRQEPEGRAEIKSPADAGPLDDLFLLRPHFSRNSFTGAVLDSLTVSSEDSISFSR